MVARVPYNLMQPLVCAEHFEHGPIMCCPFPRCVNGTTDEEIEVTPPGLDAERYRRFVWSGPNGEKYYSWEDHLSPYLMISRVLWREVIRQRLIAAEPSTIMPVIYHYTTPEGLLGIIQSGELWMTDYSYLNDAEELTYGLKLAKARFENAATRLPAAADLLSKWNTAIEAMDARVCVGSFSNDGDSLSQWRAYGPVAVGFEVGPLMFGYNNSVRMQSVIYDRAIQEKLLDLLIHLCASAYDHDKVNLSAEQCEQLYEDGTDRILEVTSFLKHPSFADECELRMVHVENPRVFERLRVNRAPQRFRVAKGLLVPYVTTRDIATFPDRYPKKLPVADIVIGPSRQGEMLERGVRELLVAYGYDAARVRRSLTPFRP